MTESADGPYPIRPITEDEFDSFEAVAEHAFHASPLSESDRRMVLERFEFDRTLAAWDGPILVMLCPSGSRRFTASS